jgi:hypothetical protein
MIHNQVEAPYGGGSKETVNRRRIGEKHLQDDHQNHPDEEDGVA